MRLTIQTARQDFSKRTYGIAREGVSGVEFWRLPVRQCFTKGQARALDVYFVINESRRLMAHIFDRKSGFCAETPPAATNAVHAKELVRSELEFEFVADCHADCTNW